MSSTPLLDMVINGALDFIGEKFGQAIELGGRALGATVSGVGGAALNVAENITESAVGWSQAALDTIVDSDSKYAGLIASAGLERQSYSPAGPSEIGEIGQLASVGYVQPVQKPIQEFFMSA